jgi:hypothetical protein
MKHLARIFVDGGEFIFTTDAPYDSQLVFEYADRYAKLQGPIRLDFEGVQWTVNASGGDSVPCGRCGSRVEELSYAHHFQILCARCARATRLTPNEPRGARTPTRKAPRRTDAGAAAGERRAVSRWRRRVKVDR